MAKRSEISGSGGAIPPADAPKETAQPLTPDTLDAQRAAAARNEKTLAPFNPPGVRTAPVNTGGVVTAAPPLAPPQTPEATTAALQDLADFFGTGESALPPQTAPVVAAPVEDAPLPPLTPEDRARMPAASDSDTPMKGLLPTLVPEAGDKFAGIDRGGFGEGGDGQYFPLDGEELKQLALALMDTLAAQLRNDLRFSIALTYPRAKVTLTLRMEGHVEESDHDFQIELVKAPKTGEKGSTALDIAKMRSDQIVFVVEQARQEFTEAGEIDSPPDAMRDELGLAKPRHVMGTNYDLGSDARAVTR